MNKLTTDQLKKAGFVETRPNIFEKDNFSIIHIGDEFHFNHELPWEISFSSMGEVILLFELLTNNPLRG